jgi:ectoine hydroxylase-related dioxygenase (phytanoyl-CoA dioxygenase family)
MNKTALADSAKNDIAEKYFEQGFYFPCTAFDHEKATAYRAKLESLEQDQRGNRLGNKGQLNFGHVIFRFADEIIRNEAILDVVESIIGPDILVWGSTFFIKEPRSQSFVSWHQDLRYWGLDSDALVSAWVALSPVNRANGCMQFIEGSHHNEILPHNDTFDEANSLTRGQEVAVDVDHEKIVHVELDPGQVSFHHGRLLHSSPANHSDQRRIGLTINYLAPHMKQVVASNDFATLVRGEDRYGHFHHIPSPAEDLDEEAIAWHTRILKAQNEALYDGTDVDAT